MRAARDRAALAPGRAVTSWDVSVHNVPSCCSSTRFPESFPKERKNIGLRVDGNAGVLGGKVTGGECSVVTQDRGASGNIPHVTKVREMQTPPWCVTSLKNVSQVSFTPDFWVMVWCLSIRYSQEPSTL